jgi:methyl-accepting chemotaxis protein
MPSIPGIGLLSTSDPNEEALEYIEARRAGEQATLDTDYEGTRGELFAEIEAMCNERQRLHREIEELKAERDEYRTRVERIEEQVDEFSAAMQSCAGGHLVSRLDMDDDEVGVQEDFNTMMNELDETVKQLKTFVTAVVDSSEAAMEDTEAAKKAGQQITTSIDDIAAGAADQTDRLQELNQEMERLSASVQEIASISGQVAQLSQKTAETGREGRQAASKAVTAIEEIEAETEAAFETIEDVSSEIDAEMENIAEITNLISRLAEQTNRLALNATVEAAQTTSSSESGFGPIAQKVKELSEETKEAVDQIEARLKHIEGKTEQAGKTIERAKSRVPQHADAIERSGGALDEIASFATETDSGVQEINEAVHQQAQSVEQVVELAEETASISEEMTGLTRDVSETTATQSDRLADVHERTEELVDNAKWLDDTLDMFKVSNADSEAFEALSFDRETLDSDSPRLRPKELTTQVGTGSATGENGFDTGAEAAKEAVHQLGADRVDFCQVFCSSRYEYRAVIEGIRSVIGDEAELIGCSSAGEFTDHSVTAESVTLGLVASDSISFFTGIGHDLSENVSSAVKEATADFPSKVAGRPHFTAINLHDGLTGLGDQIALTTLRELGRDVSFAGGSAGDDMNMENTYVFCNDEISQDAVVMALLASRRPTKIAVNHGHEPISEPLTVTDSEGSCVNELDGEPAFDVWRRAVESHFVTHREETIDFDTITPGSRRLATLLTEYEFGIEEGEGIGDNEGYKTRWPGMTETMDGPLDFAVNVPEGTTLRIMYSPKQQQIEAARETAEEAVGLLESQNVEVAGGFVYDCVCRAAILNDEFPTAIKEIADELDAPFAGFETYGELCMERGQMSGFHNTTNVTLVLPE